ncbi:MAG: hypothetical protein GX138_05425 [Firmicutes bacterium]|jgi:hypothetical protein|nr:hypothetical protein [Bacillota bacterium]
MITIFLALAGAGFLYLYLKIKTDETGKALSQEKIKSQLYLAILFFLLALVDFLIAPMNRVMVLVYRLFSALLIFYTAGKASRQIVTTIYYLTAALLLVRIILEFLQ